MTTDPDSRVILANAIDHLADSIDHLAVASQALTIPPGVPQSAGPPPTAGSPTGPPAGPPGGNGKPEKTIQQKRGGLIWGKCKDYGFSVEDIGQRVLTRQMIPDARKWTDADQQAVLDAMKEWGWLDA